MTPRATQKTPGYSGKPLAEKLGIKAGHRVQILGAPVAFAKVLGKLPAGTAIVGKEARGADCVLLFSTGATHLEPNFARAMRTLPPAGMLWVAWPKQASGVATDLTENVVRAIGLEAGLV